MAYFDIYGHPFAYKMMGTGLASGVIKMPRHDLFVKKLANFHRFKRSITQCSARAHNYYDHISGSSLCCAL